MVIPQFDNYVTKLANYGIIALKGNIDLLYITPLIFTFKTCISLWSVDVELRIMNLYIPISIVRLKKERIHPEAHRAIATEGQLCG